jgi:hypothetical protein
LGTSIVARTRFDCKGGVPKSAWLPQPGEGETCLDKSLRKTENRDGGNSIVEQLVCRSGEAIGYAVPLLIVGIRKHFLLVSEQIARGKSQ